MILKRYFGGVINHVYISTLPETNIAPDNGRLEYDPFLLGFGLFSGAFAVSFREGNFYKFPLFFYIMGT